MASSEPVSPTPHKPGITPGPCRQVVLPAAGDEPGERPLPVPEHQPVGDVGYHGRVDMLRHLVVPPALSHQRQKNMWSSAS